MYKIVFLDFDATLYSHFTNCIPESAVKAINVLHKNGIKVFLCSGRSIFEMDNFDISMIHLDGMIANNGQLIYDENKNVIFDNPISGRLKELIIDRFGRKTLPIFLNTDKTVFCNFINDKVIQTQNDINSPLPEVKDYENEKFYMCSAFCSTQQDLDELLDLNDYASITYWHDGAVDIVPNGANKAVGIEKVLEHYNLSKQEAVGIGDSDNDIEMLKYCGFGIAVGNATEETKQSADYITDHIDENGIYNALKFIKLI